jgi:hypothetical protein
VIADQLPVKIESSKKSGERSRADAPALQGLSIVLIREPRKQLAQDDDRALG